MRFVWVVREGWGWNHMVPVGRSEDVWDLWARRLRISSSFAGRKLCVNGKSIAKQLLFRPGKKALAWLGLRYNVIIITWWGWGWLMERRKEYVEVIGWKSLSARGAIKRGVFQYWVSSDKIYTTWHIKGRRWMEDTRPSTCASSVGVFIFNSNRN